jgi:hypothetical protein
VDSPKDLLERRILSGNRNTTWGEIARRIRKLYLCFGAEYDNNKKSISSRCNEIVIDVTGREVDQYISNALEE